MRAHFCVCAYPHACTCTYLPRRVGQLEGADALSVNRASRAEAEGATLAEERADDGPLVLVAKLACEVSK